MTANEMTPKIGETIRHGFGGLQVQVKVNDVKHVWGQTRALVSVDGQDSNQVWINI